MPQDLPGLYFDPVKKRYFPIKGPIPGSKPNILHVRGAPQKSNETNNKNNKHKRKRNKTTELLQVRELYGNGLTFRKQKGNFQHEYQKLQASQPVVWKYQSTYCIADSALEQFPLDIQTPVGQMKTKVLSMGSMNGSISFYEVGKVGQHFDYGIKCTPNRVWPLITKYEAECRTVPGDIWSPPTAASICLSSHISCIKRIGKHSHTDGGSPLQHALVSTLGSGTSGGSVYVLNLSGPLDFSPRIPNINRRIFEVASSLCTIWAADCNSNGSHAVIGTNLGAALVNLESGVLSWVCHSKSDIFSLQFDQSGNGVLCGFRNGVIVEVDVRQKQQISQANSSGLPRHRISYPSNIIREPSHPHAQSLTKQWFELKGDMIPSGTICMPSAVCSLVSLQSDDQYFLASSMDGSIKLYDRRLTQRGAVQAYEGNINSHTHLQLGVNPSETLVMSGGEDGCVHIWDIRTAELLFGEKLSDSALSTVCWPRTGSHDTEENLYGHDNSLEMWLGSREGLFYVHGS